jgi:hypothetical protein
MDGCTSSVKDVAGSVACSQLSATSMQKVAKNLPKTCFYAQHAEYANLALVDC